jgi:tRNA (guanine37-N1)-methyltransferase
VRIDVFTIFPGIFEGPLSESILKRAIASGLVEVGLHDIREWATSKHRSVDDYPYGGGPGMVMMAPPVVQAVEDVLGEQLGVTEVIILSPSGERFTQALAVELAARPRLALICGRYEGIDERVSTVLRARELSIGDYIMTGGELGAAVVIDVLARLIPGVIEADSVEEESHTSGLLEYPHYTRPPEFRGLRVPPVLLSGHHARIVAWRRWQALCRTLARRPDLLDGLDLSRDDRRMLGSCPPPETME